MKEDEYIICGIILFIVLLFIIIISYILYKNPNAEKVYLECPTFECATNVNNGEKRCPLDQGTIIVYDPSYEVCNSRFNCENTQTPYALLSDGSTNSNGTCEDGKVCRCMSKPSCNTNILSVFSLKNGSTQINNTGSRAIFEQNIINSMGTNSNPITFSNTNTQFCTIKANHLDIISPSPCFFNNENSITVDEIKLCMNNNPCLTGIMAFIPSDINTFNLNESSIYTYVVGCVVGEINDVNKSVINYCNGKIPVFDKITNKIQCL